jgi:anaerobic magnesium-protoporphyrin IX monomethyl ester cyclase
MNRTTVHVVLARPRDFGAVPPGAPIQDALGVGYLAAALRSRGHDVSVVDAHALDLDDDRVAHCIAALEPTIVGLSLHSFADYSHCVKISRALRELPNHPFCVWGGEHATFHAERILRQHQEVDAVALGEGEETMCALAQYVASVAQPPSAGPFPVLEPAHDAVPGAVIRGRNGELRHGGFRKSMANLDASPLPDKDIVELALAAGRPVSLSILSGRGCTHSCSFCTAHSFMRLAGGIVWRRRSVTSVVDELQILTERYLTHPLVHPVVQFQDVIFMGTTPASKRWVSEFVEEMERRKMRVPFYCMSRADSILANADILPRLVGVGLWSIEMGIEAGVDRILELYNKLNSSDDNKRAVALMQQLGITFDASGYIMFDPRMTLDELRQNALHLSHFGAATWDFFVTRLQLYPGTAVREEMIARGAFDGAEDISRTSGYSFEDPRVGAVAEHATYYNISIRDLDLLLRDAKAVIATAVRESAPIPRLLQECVKLVHNTYCDHLLQLAEHAERGDIQVVAGDLIEQFLSRVATLTKTLGDLLVLEYRRPTGGIAA